MQASLWNDFLYPSERAASNSPPAEFQRAGKNETPGSALLSWTTGLVILSFAMTAVIFISFPRFGLGFTSLNTSSSPITGFSDTVTFYENSRACPPWIGKP